MPPRQRGSAVVAVRSSSRSSSRTLPQGFAVKPRGKNDSEALWRLFNQSGFRRFGTILAPFDSPADVQAWFEGNGSGNFEVVGTIGEAVVAFAGLYPLHGRQSHVGSITLCVHDAVQGRGIGTGLLELILTSADVLAGLRRIQAMVFTDNQRAIALYHAFGFQIEGRHASFALRGDDYVDAFTMARVIPEPTAAEANADILALIERSQPAAPTASGVLAMSARASDRRQLWLRGFAWS